MEDIVATQIVGGNPGKRRSEVDFYPTPPEVTQALLDFLDIPTGQLVWEPACGEGDMVQVLERNRLKVVGTDITTGTDFLQADPPEGCHWIITNPPFSLAEDFIRKSAEYEMPFAMLLKSQYWHAARRVALFSEIPPAYVLPLAWRPDFLFKKPGKHAPLMDVIWCVWLPWQKYTFYRPLKKPEICDFR